MPRFHKVTTLKPVSIQTRLLGLGLLLGGSRRMAQKYPASVIINEETTDWDFYTSAKNTDHYFDLIKEGWEIRWSHSYADSVHLATLTHKKYPNIQIGLKTDDEIFQTAFESITEEEYLNIVWKSSPRLRNSDGTSRWSRDACKQFLETKYTRLRFAKAGCDVPADYVGF